MLDNLQLDFFKNALTQRAIQIEKNLKISADEIKTSKHNELKDEGDHAFSQEREHTNSSISKRQSEQLFLIFKSLKKIEDNCYGICEMCDNNIFIERLKVKPFAEYCVSCKEYSERR